MRDLRRILEYKNRKNPALAAGRLFIKSAQSCAGFCYCDLQTCEQRHFIEFDNLNYGIARSKKDGFKNFQIFYFFQRVIKCDKKTTFTEEHRYRIYALFDAFGKYGLFWKL